MTRRAKPTRIASGQANPYFTRIGPLGASVLQTMAAIGRPVTVREVCAQLSPAGQFTYQSVLNCSTRLTQRGLLERNLVEGTYLLRLAVDTTELAACLAVEVITAMGVNRDRVVCRVLGLDPQCDAPKIARLREETRALALDMDLVRLLADTDAPARG